MAKQSDDPIANLTLRSIQRLSRKQNFAVKGGFTLSDLMSELQEACKEIAVLIAPVPGSTGYCMGPWVCDLIAPADEAGDWKAIVYGADSCLYCVGFTIKEREVMLKGEPMKVERTTEYEFVEEEVRSERAKIARKEGRANGMYYRYAVDVRTEDVNEKDMTMQVAFSSEQPVDRMVDERTAKMTGLKRGTTYLEVLSHEKKHADFSMLNNLGAFLDEHKPAYQIGVIKRAVVSSKDKKGRALVKFDGSTDLSKTRFDQMRKGTRPHLSFGYEHVRHIGEVELSDGSKGQLFSFKAVEISSVAMPADPTVGANRALLDGDDDVEEMAHCLDCGDEFGRSDLDDDYRCDRCAGRSHTTEQTRSHEQQLTVLKEKENIMPEITEAIVTAKVTEASATARKAAITDLQTRNKEIFDLAAEKITQFGRHNKGAMEKTLRTLQEQYIQKDDTIPSAELLREFKTKMREEVDKSTPPEPYSLRDRLRSQTVTADDNDLPTDYSNYNLMRAIRSVVENSNGKKDQMPDGFEFEVHEEMIKHANEVGGMPAEMRSAGGFCVPFDAPARGFNPKTKRDRELAGRFSRDLYTGDFSSGGALVPSVPLLPMIELLRNRLVLAWAGCKTIAGLSGNIWIPRQTSAAQPSAVPETQALAATQQTFDQIEGRPRRVGNTQYYSRLLTLQSSPDIEAIIRDDNYKAIVLQIDYLGINGQGAASEPLGVMNTPGIGVVTFGGVATLGSIIQFETNIRSQNVYEPIVYLSTSVTRGRLMYVAAALLSSTVVSGQSNALWVVNQGEETIIGRPAFDSQQIPNNQMLAGAFDELLHLMWGGLQIIVDPYTRAAKDEIAITYNTYNDFAVRHPQAFCISSDSAAQ